MPPAYVKPYVKRQKNDMADAEAICEAVTRANMRFVPTKAPEQQSCLMLHRTRHLFIRQQTAVINAIGLTLRNSALSLQSDAKELLSWLWHGAENCVRFSNRPFGVKHFQAIHHCSVDVAHGLALLFGIGTKALPSWDPRTRRNNLLGGLAVRQRQVQADMRTHLIHRPARDIIPPQGGARVSSYWI